MDDKKLLLRLVICHKDTPDCTDIRAYRCVALDSLGWFTADGLLKSMKKSASLVFMSTCN